ncbi:tryptophan synthase subunit alpha [Candidatus Micrarchaeota archaeon]|nr:tryptophan synthase subunit alpha [Candidatus Micrarchaeota archaeon]
MKFSAMFEKTPFAFLPYVCLGYPTLDASIDIVRALEPFADGFELGIPFSDPVADGPVLQKASEKALQNGFQVKQAFDAIRSIRQFTQKPLAVMTYANPVWAMGIVRFANEAADAGADALIVPDVPLEESDVLREACHGRLEVPLFAAPTTTPQRLERIVGAAQGFVYVVSVAGVTGARRDVPQEALELAGSIRAKPAVIGFGVSAPEHAKAARQAGARGVIIGSKIVQAYEESGLDGVSALAESLTLISGIGTSLKSKG